MTETDFYPASSRVTTFFDGKFVEFFIVSTHPQNGELTTSEFFEERPDLGEIELLKRTSWGVSVPATARLFIAGSGRTRDELGIAWVGWTHQKALYAQSLMQEQAKIVTLQLGDNLIEQPVVVPSQAMQVYFWRQADGKWQLGRHTFTGEFGQPGVVQTQLLGKFDGIIELSSVVPVPVGNVDRGMLGWLERRGDQRIVGVALVEPSAVRTVVSKPFAQWLPLVPQRPAVHIASSGETSVAFIAKEINGNSAVLIEAICNFKNNTCVVESHTLEDKADGLVKARAFYYTDMDERRRFVCVLSTDGTLTISNLRHSRVLRRQVKDTYDFPIVTSYGGRYEAHFDADQQLYLQAID